MRIDALILGKKTRGAKRGTNLHVVITLTKDNAILVFLFFIEKKYI